MVEVSLGNPFAGFFVMPSFRYIYWFSLDFPSFPILTSTISQLVFHTVPTVELTLGIHETKMHALQTAGAFAARAVYFC